MKYGNWLIFGAIVSLAVAAPLSAQRGHRGMGTPGPRDGGPALRAGGGVERVLQLREDLELTEQQVADLNVLRADGLARRQAATATMMQLRSDLEAGEITRSEMRDALAERRATMQAEPGQMREQIERILTEEQVGILGQRARRGMRGGRSQMRGRRGDVRPGGVAPNARRGTRAGQRAFRRGGSAAFRRGFAPARGFRRPVR